MAIKIAQHSWRWWLAQKFLRLLYGRKYHYISPWKQVSVAANCLFHHKGKLLLAKRCGNIENAGCYATIGGFLDPLKKESLAEAVVREIKEEVGLSLSPDEFPVSSIRLTYLWHGREFIEESNLSTICCYYWYELTEEQVSQLQALDETAEFLWVNSAEFEGLAAQNLVPFEDTSAAIRDFFKQQNEK
ncbi:MAG: NUDIX hydrolase [Alphaproteobacteria bacterium]|nr:NUDIX hydrolase [Alphaproteobacteria bacterium]